MAWAVSLRVWGGGATWQSDRGASRSQNTTVVSFFLSLHGLVCQNREQRLVKRYNLELMCRFLWWIGVFDCHFRFLFFFPSFSCILKILCSPSFVLPVPVLQSQDLVLFLVYFNCLVFVILISGPCQLLDLSVPCLNSYFYCFVCLYSPILILYLYINMSNLLTWLSVYIKGATLCIFGANLQSTKTDCVALFIYLTILYNIVY